MRYAENTSVSSEKSRGEIERTLLKYGANGFSYGWKDGKAIITFDMNQRRIAFLLPLPERYSDEFCKTPNKKSKRTTDASQKAWEQACRQRWRALALAIKAKLEAVECEIATFEEEFLANIMLPNGKTVGDVMISQVEQSYSNGKMPPLLGFSS